ncbi:MAG: hypothetical protein AAF718_16445 [Pseudomonadota bacterium]
MRSSGKTRTLAALCSVLIVAGCAAPQEVQKSAPKDALECRQEIYDNPRDRSMATVTGGGLSLGASIAIALTTAAVSSSVASNAEAKQLTTCYDIVDAPANERLPLTAATKRRDEIVMAGGTAPKAPAVNANRAGPGGGAGFSSF